MKRLVCIDLDGTLLMNDGKISNYTISVLDKIKQQNYVLLVSGRRINEIASIFVQLGLSNENYVVCCDGMYIYKGLSAIEKTQYFINIDTIKNFVSKTNIKRFVIVTKNTDYIYCKNPLFAILKRIGNKNDRLKIISNLDLVKDEVEKIIVDAIYSQKCRIMQGDMCLDLNFFKDNHVEIMNKKTNKYTAISIIKDIYNISDDSILYFGDEINDLECFRRIKHSIAMKNAVDDLKNEAFAVTLSNDEDGVAKYLEDNFLN